MTRFGDALAQLLHEQGMSQSELARRLGGDDMTPSAVSNWVRGKNRPSRANIERIEDELAVEPRGYLLNLAGYSTDGDSQAPTAESLVRADPGLDAEDKRAILRILGMARERFAAKSH